MQYYVLNHEATYEDLKQFNYPNQKIGVIAYIENDKKEILLQQRGVKSRDDNGLYEDIGGKVELEDTSFKESILREIREEVGEDLILEISDSIGIYHCFKNNINWIFIIYAAKYKGGEFKIMEPEKCMGYQFFSYEEVINSALVSESCKFLIKSIHESKKHVLN